MLIAACGELLSRELDAAAVTPPEGTPLGALAGTVRDMARAYADDGFTFFAGGDLVNALAAFSYGSGWLHFGLAYGLLVLPGKKPAACPFAGHTQILPRLLQQNLTRKHGGMPACSIPRAPRWSLPRNLKQQAACLPGVLSLSAPATRREGSTA